MPSIGNALTGINTTILTPGQINVPNIPLPSINNGLAALAAAPISPPTMLPPAISLVFTETGYTSAGLSSLQLYVQGLFEATGLPAAVESALWSRAVSRETVLASRKQRDIVREWASRGFQKPTGMMSVQLAEAAQSVQDAGAQASREIAIKQADLIQTNRYHALDIALKINEALISYTDHMMLRSIENLKLQLSKELAVFESNLKIYEETIKATVAQTELGIELAKAQTVVAAEQAKINIEGVKASATLSVEAAKANATISAEVAKAQANIAVETAKANTSINVEIAKANVEVARANIQSKLSQAQIVMEAAKAGATVSAQLAASAMSSVNLSGSIGSSHSVQDSQSTSSTLHHGVVHAGEGPMRTEHTTYNSPVALPAT
jgi:hypothetical protein